jgi:hypothetical protein
MFALPRRQPSPDRAAARVQFLPMTPVMPAMMPVSFPSAPSSDIVEPTVVESTASGLALPAWLTVPEAPAAWPTGDSRPCHGTASHVAAAVDPEEEEEDIGDEEDLTVAQPTADDESSFDDFDDEFDDDFEEEENDPDWDHPDDGDSEPPPPGKPPGRKK